tara:strand:- start:183 stop:746 length:564 start_codon:yes stop_codon:yes gene_type:complete
MPRIYPFESYEEYVRIQTEINREKLGWVYAKPRVIKCIVDEVKFVGTVLCHGSRNGAEIKMFAAHWPHAEVLGTEISDTATQFSRTVQWDMQKQKKEWIGKWDVVYSNSFDHCIYPDVALQTWKDQLSTEGSLFLEYSEQQSVYQASDPLDATLAEVKQMLSDAGFSRVEKMNIDCQAGGVLLRCRP